MKTVAAKFSQKKRSASRRSSGTTIVTLIDENGKTVGKVIGTRVHGIGEIKVNVGRVKYAGKLRSGLPIPRNSYGAHSLLQRNWTLH
jgi:hypothetical protein